MGFEVVEIDEAARAQVLAVEESHIADLKARAIKPSKLTKSLSAFANAEGGELFIGVEENDPTKKRVWRGFADVEDANGHIQALEATFPIGEFVDYQFLRVAGASQDGLVLKVSVLKTPDVRAASDGTVYVRRGAQCIPVSGRL